MIALSLKPLTDEDAVEFEFERIERAREFAANELAEWLGASMDPGNGATGDSCDGEEVARIALDYANAIVHVLAWTGEQPIFVEGGFAEGVRMEARA